MPTPLNKKSTIDEIRKRFDADVERFSNLDTGQAATIDAPLMMDLVTSAAIATSPTIQRVLDIGCGAGNYTIKLRQKYAQPFQIDLVDLSQLMLDRAVSRLSTLNDGPIAAIQGRFPGVDLPQESFDVVIAAAVLHHLRGDDDWQAAFEKIFAVLKPGGSIWIADLVTHEIDAIHQMMWARYGDFLVSTDGAEYRDRVFEYIDREDSPRPVTWQLDLLRRVGFKRVELLHKNSCFAAFGGIKGK